MYNSQVGHLTMTVIFMRGSSSPPVIQTYHSNNLARLKGIRDALEKDLSGNFKMWYSIA